MYIDGDNAINRGEIQTLAGNRRVMNCVIDAWAKILNDEGKAKDKVYFSTGPAVSIFNILTFIEKTSKYY